MREIAAKYGVHRGSISKFVLRAGRNLRAAGLSEQGRSQANALYREGHTLEEVGKILGVDAKTVRNALIGDGCLLRPRGRRPSNTKPVS